MKLDLVGHKFGNLTVLADSGSRSNSRQVLWLCLCDCGAEKVVITQHLKSGATVSCGCYNRVKNVIHGNKKHELYSVWHNMLARCYNPNNSAYKFYGKRGIEVCESWRESVNNFIADMEPRPEGYTLEREDSNGNYSKENCVWATQFTQNRNRRSNRYLEYKGIKKCLKDWAAELGVDYRLFMGRLDRGWSIEKTFETPIREFRGAVRNNTGRTTIPKFGG